MQPQAVQSEALSPILKFLLSTKLSPEIIFIIILLVSFAVAYLLFFVSSISIAGLYQQFKDLTLKKKISLIIFIVGGICITWIFFKVAIYDEVPVFLKIISEKIIVLLERINILK